MEQWRENALRAVNFSGNVYDNELLWTSAR